MIANGVHYRAKSEVRLPVVGPIQLLHQLFKPGVRALNRGIENVEAR
jgi:hypothetical protein